MNYNWKNVWDKKQTEAPLVTEEVGKREHPGASRRERKTYHDWLFCDAHPKKYGAMSTPPPGVETWLKDVFGDRAKELLVFMHPHLKRWCLGERHRDPRMGENMYQVIWICSEAPEEETDGDRKGEWAIPTDYKGDRFLECFGQFVGEFKIPTKQDFIEIEAGDKKKYGVDQVNEMFQAREDAPQIEKDKQESDRIEDFLDYYFNLAVDEANQRAGSGWHMRSVPTVGYKVDPKKWYYSTRDGYQTRTRKGTQAYLRELMQDLQSKHGTEGERGLFSGAARTPEQRAEAMAEYERMVHISGTKGANARDIGQALPTTQAEG